MKNLIFRITSILTLSLSVACSQKSAPIEPTTSKVSTETVSPVKAEQKLSHNYGGWYCPDNLHGFPPVNIKNWENVPVINGRMSTKKETQTEASLIYVDPIEYPSANVLPITMPKLARYYSYSSQKEELVIVIQAMRILNDSIVGFRYLNGGNGSSHLSEVTFLTDVEIKKLTPTRFVSFSIEIDATQNEIWKVLTEPEYFTKLQPTFDNEESLSVESTSESKVNFRYVTNSDITAQYADKLFGNQYIQIDAKIGDLDYVEKFILLENQDTHITELKVVCGPYADDFELQQTILKNWATKVKSLSEN